MSLDGIVFRPARFDDLPQLLAFEQGIVAAERPFDPTLKPDEIHYYDLEALIRSSNAHVVVAEQKGRLVASGFAEIRTAKPYLRHSRYAYLGFMYVDPELRGQGLNGHIVDALVDWARKRDVTEVRLEVYAGNDPARRAYEKLGFAANLVEMRINTR